MAGLAMISPNSAFVFGLNAAAMPSEESKVYVVDCTIGTCRGSLLPGAYPE